MDNVYFTHIHMGVCVGMYNERLDATPNVAFTKLQHISKSVKINVCKNIRSFICMPNDKKKKRKIKPCIQ